MSKLIRCDNPACRKEAVDAPLYGWFHVEGLARSAVIARDTHLGTLDAHFCSAACVIAFFQAALTATGAPTQRLPDMPAAVRALLREPSDRP